MKRLLGFLKKKEASGARPDACISFPKSGRTWLRVMLDELGIELEYSHAGSQHKTGHHISRLNTASEKKYNKIIFLHRDPRDTVVSGYHQKQNRRDGFEGNISNFIRHPNYGIEKVIRFNQIWCALARKRDKMIVVTYEQLRYDTVGTMRTIVAFLGFDVTEVRLTQAVENANFERMQHRERSGFYKEKYGKTLSLMDPGNENSAKVRKGKVGGYKEELSPDDIAYCNAVIERAGI